MLKKRIVVSLFFTIFIFFCSRSLSFAHSGRTDSSGCHNCYTSYCYGEYHCHNGGGSDLVYNPPEIVIPTIPTNTNASWKYFINNEGGVDMIIDWDRPDNKLYSIVLSKYAGGDPGPNADTDKSEYVFKNVKPGKWYINIKEEFDGYWSEVVYWTADIPNNVKETAIPYSTPTPIPTKQTPPTTSSTNSNDPSNSFQTIAMVGLGGGIYHFFNKLKRK